MSGVFSKKILMRIAAVSVVWASFVGLADAQDGTPMTGKLMADELEGKEFVWFVTGLVEGMAYARFRKDTLAAGHKVQDGMSCIREWYHGKPERILEIEDGFRKYEQYTAWVVLGVMIKEACGE